MRALRKNPLVDCDLEEAALWYHRQDPEVAEQFLREAEGAMVSAASDPFQFPIRFKIYRKIKLHRFQHLIYFREFTDRVRIVAIIHGARDVQSLLRARQLLDEPE